MFGCYSSSKQGAVGFEVVGQRYRYQWGRDHIDSAQEEQTVEVT